MRGLRLVSVMLCLLAAPLASRAAADAATDAFHAAIDGAYRHYREAIHYHETGNAELADLALDQFAAAWKALAARYADKAPPGYDKDPAFAETLKAIEGKAASAIGSAPAEALLALRPIRADLAALRKRNNQRVFSDCVDAMNAAMDRLWSFRQRLPAALKEWDYYVAMQRMEYAYQRCREEAPAALRQSAEFKRLIEGALASLARLHTLSDTDTIVSLLRELRSFDKLIWLRFG
jgi:hypothetical protein